MILGMIGRHRPGRIVILNGAPRSGKSSIAAAMQSDLDGPWMNLGVDAMARVAPDRLRPGIGLRPGGERPDLEPFVPLLYAALYESVAAQCRLGLDVVVDVGHHERYTRPLHILTDCARRLAGLDVTFVGVRCPVAEIMRRRALGQSGREGQYEVGTAEIPIPPAVIAWERGVHDPGLYDLEVDTSVLRPVDCARAVADHLATRSSGASAFARLAATGQGA